MHYRCRWSTVAVTLRENLLTANLFYNLSSAAISFSQALQQTALFLYVFVLNTPHPQPFALQILPPRSQRPVYQHRRLPDSYRNPTLHRLLRFVQWTRHSEGPPQANRRCRWHDFLRGPRWVTGVVRFTYIDYVGYVSFHRQRLQQYNPMIGNCEWRTILRSTYRHCIHESCSQGANSQSPKTSEHKPTEPSFEKSQACTGTPFWY